jgi:hypothetical protein
VHLSVYIQLGPLSLFLAWLFLLMQLLLSLWLMPTAPTDQAGSAALAKGTFFGYNQL